MIYRFCIKKSFGRYFDHYFWSKVSFWWHRVLTLNNNFSSMRNKGRTWPRVNRILKMIIIMHTYKIKIEKKIKCLLKYSFFSWIIKIVMAYLNWKALVRSSEFRKNFESTWKKVHWINEWLPPNELSVIFSQKFF